MTAHGSIDRAIGDAPSSIEGLDRLEAALAEGADINALLAAQQERHGHDCDANAVPYTSDGALGHGWECGICGRFLQAG